MLTQEQAVEIRILARQGESIRQISRRTGLSRNTVRRYLRDEPARRYRSLLEELRRHDESLLELPRIVCLSKMDLADPEAGLPALEGMKPLEISSVTSIGINELRSLIKRELEADTPPTS